MADRRRIATIGGRTASGLIGLGVAVLAVAGATLLPLPQLAIGVPVQTVRPVPADQQRVCPGPALELAADAGAATEASAIGEAAVAYGTDGPGAETRRLNPDAETKLSSQAPLAVAVSTPDGSTTPPLFAGAQVQTVSSPDTAGLAAASCSEPTADAWLVGGSTALGQTSLVLLSNPTSVDADVALTIYTETGRVDAPGATGVVVPAGAQKVVALSGFAPSAAAPVVHVTATGGQVAVSLQQSFEQGIQPRGVELTGPTGEPSRTQRMTGVTIASIAAVTAAQSAESVGVEFPVVRILVPGDKDAKLTIGAVGEAGTAAGSSYARTVKAGSVAEIPLDHLKDGSYTVTVQSDVPIVAATRTSVIGSKTRDFAWFVSSAPLNGSQFAAIPGGPSPVLHLANPGEEDVKVTIQGESGAPIALTVPAEGGANHVLPAGKYTLGGVGGLTASVSFAADGALSTFPLNPPGALATPIAVYPN
ncbi:hypothetical protein O159_06380 [Leifsonia xyli subsp. cynodontis DSM 46306]|uniref:Large extracellular alpha-helical protein n=1 Tax=Leifsonia xyli subsp. cynodontis DSM 46306 TaxID=1389489 RepID=U3PBF0_LEIXC|nr:DUF5719 family protein [Leifsonia xyli]AGW40818.1 hypothetical protein O159_06380 [Leifsonia xyli subsp. cynodontis DSM 46306]